MKKTFPMLERIAIRWPRKAVRMAFVWIALPLWLIFGFFMMIGALALFIIDWIDATLGKLNTWVEEPLIAREIWYVVNRRGEVLATIRDFSWPRLREPRDRAPKSGQMQFDGQRYNVSAHFPSQDGLLTNVFLVMHSDQAKLSLVNSDR